MCWMGREGDVEGLSRLLDEGVDPIDRREREPVSHDLCNCLLQQALQYSITALHVAAKLCRLAVVRLLVERAPHLLEARDRVSGILVFARWLTVGSADSCQHTSLP
jgi:hypothetical protein